MGRTYAERSVIDAVRGLRIAAEEKAARTGGSELSSAGLSVAEKKKLAELAKKKAKREAAWKKKVCRCVWMQDFEMRVSATKEADASSWAEMAITGILDPKGK